MATVINTAPIPPEGAQVLTYRVALVLDSSIEIAYRLRLGARLAELIAQANMDGVLIDAIPTTNDRDLNITLCQITVDLGYGGQVPPRLPGNHTKEQ